MLGTFLSVGEVMMEMSDGPSGDLWRMGYAGDTLNTAWYAKALLGDDWSVSYFTALGVDGYSGRIEKFLQDARINTSRILKIPERRLGLYFIHQEDGERRFTYWRDSSAAKLLARDEDALHKALRDSDHIYFSGITLAILDEQDRRRFLEAIRHRRESGSKVSFDPNIRPSLWRDRSEMLQCISAAGEIADIVLPTFGDEQLHFGDLDPNATADRYTRLGASEVVVKNGPEPALVRSGARDYSVAGISVSDVVDTTGAGDSFNGAYLAARLSGSDVEASAELAHRVASLCIQHRGALVPFNLMTSTIATSSRCSTSAYNGVNQR